MIKHYTKNLLYSCWKFPSRTAIWLSLAIVLVINLSYENWNNDYKIIAWDINHYYAYLPMVFIYGDIDMDFVHNGEVSNPGDHYWPIVTEKGKYAIMTSMGMSMMYAPFFLAGHLFVYLTDYPGNEFSEPYKISLILSCLFYFFIGLLFLRKVLLKYYSEEVTAITLLLIVFGTNLLHYLTEEPTMTHAYNFALISIFIYLVISWFKKNSIKNAILLGGLAGLITLIRPSNVIVILLLVFWGIISFKELGNRLLLYLKKPQLTLIMMGSFILVWVPQFIYWYYVSGNIFLNTYGDGSSFFFDNPQFYHLLFSYRKGWFVYTPIMFVAVFGFYFLYKKHRGVFWPVLIYLIICSYILASWWSWWNGGSFGLRSFIDMYGLMAFPLAAIIDQAFSRKYVVRITVILLLTAVMGFNILQTWQAKRGYLHNSMMTKTSYWHMFLRFKGPPQAYWDNLAFPDYNAAKKGIYYPDTEVPLIIENKFGMRGWEYLDHLKDSFAGNPEILNKINAEGLTGSHLDSLVSIEAKAAFDSLVDHYYKSLPNLDPDNR